MRFDVTFVDYCTDRILPKEETTAYKLAKCKNEIEDWSEEEKKAHSVYSVLAGNSVTYLSEYNIDHDNYFLDYQGSETNSWCSKVNKIGDWIQVNSVIPVFWTGIVMQGGNNGHSWIKTLKVSYSLNGVDWKYADNSKVYTSNTDPTTKVPIEFDEPIYARVVRIIPQTWQHHLCLRFDALFADINCHL